MDPRVGHHHGPHCCRACAERLERIETDLARLVKVIGQPKKEGETLMADLSAITAAVTKNGDAVSSAVTLLQSLSAQLSAVATDPAAVQALADQINAEASNLANAVVANTPAAPSAVAARRP
jgi:septal ring factor EnvC (AmiA/AmiB activator)